MDRHRHSLFIPVILKQIALDFPPTSLIERTQFFDRHTLTELVLGI